MCLTSRMSESTLGREQVDVLQVWHGCPAGTEEGPLNWRAARQCAEVGKLCVEGCIDGLV